MTQAENNKAAMDNIFALEDSKELFEAVGNLNDDQSMLGAPQDNTEYGVDDMLTVVPGSTDPFAGQSITTQQQQEPSDEEKKFVIDEFASQMAQAHKTIVDKEAIDTFSPIIQDKVSMDVNKFLTGLQNVAAQRLSAQNVSDAQPNGATPEESLALADQQQQGGMDAGMDPDAAMGTPAMEPAPGGIVAEPSLDANVGDGLSGDMGAAPSDDLGLGGIDDNMGGDMGELGADAGTTDNLGLDGITDDGFGAEGGEPAAEGGELGGADGGEPGAEGGDSLGLDAIGDDEGAGEPGTEGGELGGTEGGEPGSEDDTGSEGDSLGGSSNLDSLDDSQFGGDDDGGDSDFGDESDADFEAEMASNAAILESLHTKYVEDKAREEIRNLVESFQRMKGAKKAQFEAEEAEKTAGDEPAANDKPAETECANAKPAETECANAKPVETECANAKPAETECQTIQESADEAKRDELGGKVAAAVESASASKAQSILENAEKAFVGAARRKNSAAVRKSLLATLESISTNYHVSVARENAAKAEKAKKALAESASKAQKKVPAPAPKQSSLAQKLNRLVASTK